MLLLLVAGLLVCGVAAVELMLHYIIPESPVRGLRSSSPACTASLVVGS